MLAEFLDAQRPLLEGFVEKREIFLIRRPALERKQVQRPAGYRGSYLETLQSAVQRLLHGHLLSLDRTQHPPRGGRNSGNLTGRSRITGPQVIVTARVDGTFYPGSG